MTYGPHLALDLKKCNKDKLGNLDFIFNLLDTLPAKIGMTKITQPYVFMYHGAVPDDWGITGFVVIAESHISIHTYPNKDYLFFDIFSCKPFDIMKTKELIKDAFEAKGYTEYKWERGNDFPRR